MIQAQRIRLQHLHCRLVGFSWPSCSFARAATVDFFEQEVSESTCTVCTVRAFPGSTFQGREYAI